MHIDESLVEQVRMALIIALKIAAPLLASGVAIGLIISILQSVTSIQDQTLTFVPKIFGMIIVAIVLISWIVSRLVEFTTEMFTFTALLWW
jgi:flagellar biosynthetic protein FliQ